MKTDEELDKILDEIPRRRFPVLWDSWPEELHVVIAHAAAENDAGRRNVGETDLRMLAKTRYGIVWPENTLQRYARDKMGRRSWRKP